jgi:hypothetical protein
LVLSSINRRPKNAQQNNYLWNQVMNNNDVSQVMTGDISQVMSHLMSNNERGRRLSGTVLMTQF